MAKQLQSGPALEVIAGEGYRTKLDHRRCGARLQHPGDRP